MKGKAQQAKSSGQDSRRKASPLSSRGRNSSPVKRGSGGSAASNKLGMPSTPSTQLAHAPEASTPAIGSPVSEDSSDSGPAPSRVTVAVRVKPTHDAKTIMRFGQRQENALKFSYLEGAKAGEDPKGFAFDHLFDHADGQAEIYDALGAKVLQQVVTGHNASVFAYGQTGSGKTYTMLGTPEQRGLIPRLCEGLFQEEAIKGWAITVSFFEIYNEQVVDLLAEAPADGGVDGGADGGGATASGYSLKRDHPSAPQQAWTGVGLDPKRTMPVLNALRVREHAKHGVYVEGLNKVAVTSPKDIEQALERGMAQRAVAETAMNAESSRSHAVVQLSLAEEVAGDRTATLNLIDLAGSENVGRSKSHEDHSRLAEARNINKSLLGLGKCISMLAQGTNNVVPYRDSVLTWLLKDALGGNAHTLMLCAVDPSSENAEQTLTTLRYADQAKKIVTKPIENVDHTKKMVRQLHEQVEELRAAAEAAAAAQAAAKAQQAAAEQAMAAAKQAAEQAAAERERAVAEAVAARESEALSKAEKEEAQRQAEAREKAAREREEQLKGEAVQAAEQLKAAKLEAQAGVAAAAAGVVGAGGAGAASGGGSRPAMSPTRLLSSFTGKSKADKAAAAAAAAASSAAAAAASSGAELGAGSALPAPVDASAASAFPTIDINAVAAMSREEKLAFMKKLKEERKALYVELGIEEETKATKAAKAAEAEAAAKAMEM